ncbi:peptidyl-prolyl cis-trans isomerase FKBP19, chloroplastic [Lolium perenne]|uniref:peptidyl-prolyl cis-trans isomerase FKBP19, chloroplastic n=1 Tax=Lolium perenne TaxID=4522 RepID=UPI0021F5B575|nr:peptidyl-prolyl cis-trans isomerase FKBP19, chloroplastic [Lolium perenne]XP_051208070.1 peptidyl-prolyl cis-trans isomerase FKBP19, chloroplastic [Lolium perenne]
MSSPACRPGLPAPRRQATLLLQPAAPPSVSRRPIHRTASSRSTFEVCSPGARRRQTRVIPSCHGGMIERRRLLLIPAITITIGSFQYSLENGAAKAEFTDMPALRGKDYGKTKMSYPDYTETESGLQYKDLRVGDGPSPKKGETVVVDWDGYTIGYYGRIFEARNKTKGGSFEGGDKEFFKFKIGSGQVIPAFEEAMTGMRPGGVRRIIVPPDIGYPDNDLNKLGPKPTTFSGQRALDFVLRNQGLIDKTLLFDIELIRIVPTQ